MARTLPPPPMRSPPAKVDLRGTLPDSPFRAVPTRAGRRPRTRVLVIALLVVLLLVGIAGGVARYLTADEVIGPAQTEDIGDGTALVSSSTAVAIGAADTGARNDGTGG